MLLRSLLDDAEIVGALDVRVAHCTTDPRACRSGDVYIALDDEGVDGHRAADEAVRLGAAAVVASRPVSLPVPVAYVEDTRTAYGRICQGLAGNPSTLLKTIGVAGSLGKTTTGYLIASVLQAAGRAPGMIGSLGYCDGVELADARWTTPPPPVTAAWLSRMVDNGCTHAVLEASPRGLARDHTAGIVFDTCCFTNLHRETFAPTGQACESRRIAARLLGQLSSEGVLIANVDDAGSAAAAGLHDGPVITVGLHSPAELTATLIERHPSEQTFLLSFGRETVPVRSHLVGSHNLANCLLAAAVGTVYGIAPEVIVRGIESVSKLPGRLERIECGQPFTVFLDEARSPAALATCLETLRATTAGRLFCVFDQSADDTRRIGEWTQTMQAWCDEVIVTTAAAQSGDRPSRRRHVERSEAIGKALRGAQAGDCVLIAGGDPYDAEHPTAGGCDDRQIVRRMLYQMPNEEAPRRRSA
jgi:UDP-N-acetylmuramoyl-L-alanyl-D-glutamate--2,6-diaminopimelate ligase